MIRPLRLAPFLLVAAAASFGARAEDLRTMVAGVVALSAEAPEGARVSMGYNDAVAVLLVKDSPFVQGFELEIKLPPQILSLPGGFAYELWKRIEPAPDKAKVAYRGERIITQPLPSRAGLVLQIPVHRDHTLRGGPYATLVPIIVEPRDFPFFFKLIPVAKGVTAEVESAQIQLRVRPVLTDEGALSLRLRYPDGHAERSPVAVAVDDRRVDPALPLLLKAGVHRLHLTSENYRDESRSFTIEQGRTLELVVELQDTTPVLVVEAPDSAIVTLDGARIDHVQKPQLAIEAGDHSATCRIGDYVVTRKFTVFRGKTYRLVLAVELQLQEGP